MTNNFAPISAKNITDFGIPSDLCSVEILAVTIGVYRCHRWILGQIGKRNRMTKYFSIRQKCSQVSQMLLSML